MRITQVKAQEKSDRKCRCENKDKQYKSRVNGFDFLATIKKLEKEYQKLGI